MLVLWSLLNEQPCSYHKFLLLSQQFQIALGEIMPAKEICICVEIVTRVTKEADF